MKVGRGSLVELSFSEGMRGHYRELLFRILKQLRKIEYDHIIISFVLITNVICKINENTLPRALMLLSIT